VDNHIISRGSIIDGAGLGSAGGLEEIGELRDIDTTAFTDDAGIEGLMPGGEDALEVPVAVESRIYCDYYDTFGSFTDLHLLYSISHAFY
jgi:hypothetical protein